MNKLSEMKRDAIGAIQGTFLVCMDGSSSEVYQYDKPRLSPSGEWCDFGMRFPDLRLGQWIRTDRIGIIEQLT